LYAAVALVGRVVFAFSSAVINTMFPVMAGTRSEQRKGHSVLAISLLLVLGIGSVIALGLRLAPAGIWTALFGSQFSITGKYGLPYLLALYAATTVVYCLSVVIIAYEMSYKIANTSWVQLAFSGVLFAGICRFHSSLQEVIWIQLVLMLALLIVLAVPFLWKMLLGSEDAPGAPSAQGIRTIRRVSEDEVIAEFLKSDFENAAFEEYQESLRELVMKPCLDDAGENAKRRALLFIRHLPLWRELPRGTEWFEVEVRPADLGQIRVFPRAVWRKLARGNFAITAVVERIRTYRGRDISVRAFLRKISSLRDWLSKNTEPGAVLLIGLNESEPFTILDGNHRLVAATLTSIFPPLEAADCGESVHPESAGQLSPETSTPVTTIDPDPPSVRVASQFRFTLNEFVCPATILKGLLVPLQWMPEPVVASMLTRSPTAAGSPMMSDGAIPATTELLLPDANT